jgi:signal transduction histidine kinase/tetratricopeptide (TPR) repeat protein
VAAPVVAQRYRILDRIGQGGMGVVYRVEDLVDREIRALKVLPRGADRRTSALRTEFAALAGLRHENIVRVFDYGTTDGGDDYFTMELVPGRSLLEAGPRPGDPSFYPLLGGLIRALAFLHARGIVHADVKPSNVLVDETLLESDPTRAARLVDFGLSALGDKESGRRGRGTFPYAAPEAWAGRLDARSDLYSLGILLWEWACRQSPFPGTDIGAVVRRQRQGPPADPRTIRPDLDAGLAELILALTEPEPGARLQSADEVLDRINELGGTQFPVSAAAPRLDLTGTMVGRERDLGTLWEAWERLSAAPVEGGARATGQVVLIAGEEGIGKTRLLAELKLKIQLAGGRVHWASAFPRQDAPVAGLADVARAVSLELADRPTAARRLESRRAALAPLFGEVRMDADGARPKPITTSRFALAEGLAGLFVDASALEPMAILVDDVQAADRGTMEALAYLARAAPAGRLLLVLAGRGDLHEGRLGALAAGLAHLERWTPLPLPPLDRAAVRALVSAIFGPAVSDAYAAELHRASGGNPAYLERMLESLLERGAIGRRRGAWELVDEHAPLPAPPDAVARALAAAERLSLRGAALLGAAVVLGERFDVGLLAAVTGLGEDELAGGLSELAVARLVLPDPDLGGLVLTPCGAREALLGRLPDDERRRLHRAAITALEAHSRPRASSIAPHLLAVGDPRAPSAAMAAGDERLAALDHHGALEWYVRAAELAPNPDVVEKLAELRASLGDLAAAEADFRQVLEALPHDAATQGRIARRMAEVLRVKGRTDEAIDLLMKALAAVRAARLGSAEAGCHLSLARVFMYRGDYAAATEHASVGAMLARAAKDNDLTALLAMTRADIDVFRGDPRGALAHVERAISEAIGAGERVLADLHGTRGRASIHDGDYAKAIESLERSVSLHQRHCRVEQEAKMLNNLGAACYFQGAWDRAQSSWERFAQLCERMGDAQELAVALNNLGLIARDRGDLPVALGLLDRARRIAQKADRRHTLGMILGNRGETLFRQGDLAAAREHYETCLGIFEPLGAREDVIETKRRLCELDLAGGRVDAALDRAIDAARDAQAAGAKLEEGVLHRVAANALRLQGDLSSSLWFIERAREILTTLGASHELARVDLETAELCTARGKDTEAEAHLTRAVEAFAALGARWDLARARERKRDFESSHPSGEGPVATEKVDRLGLEVLLDVIRASGRMDLEKLLGVVLDKVLEVTAFDRGFILLLDERGRPTERMRRTKEDDGFELDSAQSNFSGSIVKRVAQTGEAAAVIDIADDAFLRQSRSVVALGLRSVMCAPMRLKGQVTGIIYVDSKRLAENDLAPGLALLEALAAQAAIAIENARLVGEEQRKNELMTILAHEIRNPLAGILGFSELMPEEAEEMPPRYVQLMARIHQDAQRLKRLVDNILELARVESGKVEWVMAPVAVGSLLADARDAYAPLAAKKRVEIVTEIADDLPPALGNADRLFQVLSNLLGNALKFTPDGGKITLSASVETAMQPEPTGDDDLRAWLPLGPEAPRRFVRIEVTDTGPGIPPERRAHLFEKFAQGADGKRVAHGVGLGLFISRDIVRRHGGTIAAEAPPNGGSMFVFRIPAAG